MCISAIAMTMMAAGTGLSVASSLKSAKEARKGGAQALSNSEADAATAEGEGRVIATKVRKAAVGLKSEADAQFVAAGVDVNGGGSVDEINKHIIASNEQDAMQSIYDAKARAAQIRLSGQVANQQAKTQSRNLMMQAAATGLRGWGGMLGGGGGGAAPIDRTRDTGYVG